VHLYLDDLFRSHLQDALLITTLTQVYAPARHLSATLPESFIRKLSGLIGKEPKIIKGDLSVPQVKFEGRRYHTRNLALNDLREIVSGANSYLIFTLSISEAEKLRAEIPDAGLYHSKLTREQKRRALSQFDQNNKMIATSGFGTGINLTCHLVIHWEGSHCPIDHYQHALRGGRDCLRSRSIVLTWHPNEYTQRFLEAPCQRSFLTQAIGGDPIPCFALPSELCGKCESFSNPGTIPETLFPLSLFIAIWIKIAINDT